MKRVDNSCQSTSEGDESGEESIPTDDELCDETVDNVLPEINPKSVPMETVTQPNYLKLYIYIQCM